jgi:hypothetical protein
VVALPVAAAASAGDAALSARQAVASAGHAGRFSVEEAYSAVAPSLADVSCSSTEDCVAVGKNRRGGGSIVATRNGGADWFRRVTPSGVKDLNALSCVSGSDCVAVGEDTAGRAAIIASKDGGFRWAVQRLPGAVSVLADVSCDSASDCVAVGHSRATVSGLTTGVIVATANGGSTWTIKAAPDGLESLSAISCVSARRCVVAGNALAMKPTVLTTASGGKAWTAASAPPGMRSIGSISCMSADNCVAVGTTVSKQASVVVTGDGGTSWVRKKLPAGVKSLAAVSSLGPVLCRGGWCNQR